MKTFNEFLTAPVLYFAYGSNMLAQRIKDRCPSAVSLGTRTIDGYRFMYNKPGLDGSAYANIMSSEHDYVVGVLYKMTLCDIIKLDIIEQGYSRKQILTREGDLSFIYISNYCDNSLMPSIAYRNIVKRGAKNYDISDVYISYYL